MKEFVRHIALFLLGISWISSLHAQQLDSIDFFKEPFLFNKTATAPFPLATECSSENVKDFYNTLESENYATLLQQLKEFKSSKQLSDWLYYQLVRRVAEAISPKAENYHRYTLYKWYLMNKSGYDARLAVGEGQIIFYIKNQEDIADIPYFIIDGQQFTCLNFHDYGKLFKRSDTYIPVDLLVPGATKDFSYKIQSMPEFKDESYAVKNVNFQYKDKVYDFDIKVNDNLTNIFKNYPGVDFETYFNIPLTQVTYQSLIPVLKDNVKNLETKEGVDYLMRFTRYAFLYENDDSNFGKEKRLSPGQTLMTEYSDCDDRAALFFYLVKEIYDLPMIAILFPTHITMGVQFEKPIGTVIAYHGKYYSICEPTPQKENLRIGQLSKRYQNETYQIVYHYSPLNK